jgi:DNA topoisomerase-3
MKLVITEKPSVAQAISKVIGAYKREKGYLEGSGYLVSWCVGHLVELAQPQDYDEKYAKWRLEDLPLFPDRWKYQVSPRTADQFHILKQLMERSDVTELIEATDAGREGELIFRLVYQQAGCTKPFKRLWISSMEDSAIRDGFANLRDSRDYDNLYAAAVARARADWLVGINGTRLFSKCYNRKLTVGRVQTPTLAMVVERQKKITDFQKEKYWNVHLNLDGLDVVKEKCFEEKSAQALVDHCRTQSAVVTQVTCTEKSVRPPRLYDLTTLQREANRYYGYTAQQTLDLAQSLYEKKLVSYPRTDSQFLTYDMESTAWDMLAYVYNVFQFDLYEEPQIIQVLNNRKVSDHHAIIPTAEIAKQDLSTLSQGEQDILLLISQRLFCATAGKQHISETEVKVVCAGEEFTAKGKMILEKGWKAIEDDFRGRLKTKKKPEPTDTILPEVFEGQVFAAVNANLSEHYTTPPKAYTEDTLLSAMETAGNDSFDEDTEKKGLGTPATRASMIEKLVSNQYLQRKGKQLIPTEDGMALVEILPSSLKSPSFTAYWENSLMNIERGTYEPEAFIGGIMTQVM